MIAHGTYVESVSDPGTAPADDPVVCFRINQSWVPYMVGCALQLLQPAAWTADSAALPDLLGRVNDLLNIIGTSEVCVTPELQLTSGGELQYSLDGGATWTTVGGWAANFPLSVRSSQARAVMASGYSDPPIPEQTSDGTDWAYSPSP